MAKPTARESETPTEQDIFQEAPPSVPQSKTYIPLHLRAGRAAPPPHESLPPAVASPQTPPQTRNQRSSRSAGKPLGEGKKGAWTKMADVLPGEIYNDFTDDDAEGYYPVNPTAASQLVSETLKQEVGAVPITTLFKRRFPRHLKNFDVDHHLTYFRTKLIDGLKSNTSRLSGASSVIVTLRTPILFLDALVITLERIQKYPKHTGQVKPALQVAQIQKLLDAINDIYAKATDEDSSLKETLNQHPEVEEAINEAMNSLREELEEVKKSILGTTINEEPLPSPNDDALSTVGVPPRTLPDLRVKAWILVAMVIVMLGLLLCLLGWIISNVNS